MDLTFHTNQGCFNYRVGAVILRDGKLLLMHNDKEDIYYTVGGRVQFGESTQEAILREVREELAIELEIDRPLCFHESFYVYELTGEVVHEIAVYYLMKNTPALERIHCTSVTALGAPETLHWVPVAELRNHHAVPTTLFDRLDSLTGGMRVVTEREAAGACPA